MPAAETTFLTAQPKRNVLLIIQVGGSGKIKIPKTEEIQSLEYRFRAESEAESILEESSAVQDEKSVNGKHDYILS